VAPRSVDASSAMASSSDYVYLHGATPRTVNEGLTASPLVVHRFQNLHRETSEHLPTLEVLGK
jgi:hypothetical protein